MTARDANASLTFTKQQQAHALAELFIAVAVHMGILPPPPASVYGQLSVPMLTEADRPMSISS